LSGEIGKRKRWEVNHEGEDKERQKKGKKRREQTLALGRVMRENPKQRKRLDKKDKKGEERGGKGTQKKKARSKKAQGKRKARGQPKPIGRKNRALNGNKRVQFKRNRKMKRLTGGKKKKLVKAGPPGW